MKCILDDKQKYINDVLPLCNILKEYNEIQYKKIDKKIRRILDILINKTFYSIFINLSDSIGYNIYYFSYSTSLFLLL
jgi:hypothetical protein